MKKTTPALITAFIITVILGAGMLLIGLDAQSGATAAAASTSPAISSKVATTIEQTLTQDQQQIDLNSAQLAATGDQLAQAQQQIQQYKSILAQLQSAGMISMASDGTITINQAGRTNEN